MPGLTRANPGMYLAILFYYLGKKIARCIIQATFGSFSSTPFCMHNINNIPDNSTVYCLYSFASVYLYSTGFV